MLYAIHPRYLTDSDLIATWNYALKLQHDYFAHDTLLTKHPSPVDWLGFYLWRIYNEIDLNRDFIVNLLDIKIPSPTTRIHLSEKDFYTEWTDYQKSLQEIDPIKMSLNDGVDIARIKANPMFYVERS